MARYINASDLGKLLGSKYSFHWTSESDIQRIIFNKPQESEVKKAIQFLPENTISETIHRFVEPETDISKIKGVLKKRKIRIPEQPSEIVKEYNKSELERVIEESKKEITQNESHSGYSKVKEAFSEQLPESLQKVVERSFNMERGNIEEERIIKNFSIKKTNKLEYSKYKHINILRYKRKNI
jgi:arsenate reductase-like glutaredoxin family protein